VADHAPEAFEGRRCLIGAPAARLGREPSAMHIAKALLRIVSRQDGSVMPASNALARNAARVGCVATRDVLQTNT
jgi:hypothetical protein